MEKINISKKYNGKAVVALGFFDAVHLGHKYLLDTATSMARQVNALSAVFTFSNNPLSFFGNSKQILTFDERCCCFENCGVDLVLYSEMTQDMQKWSGKRFLDSICASIDVCAFVVGGDYTFGAEAAFGTEYLKKYGEEHGITVKIVDFVTSDTDGCQKKISSRDIRNLLSFGETEQANALLSEPFFLINQVVHCSGRGHVLGFPTANVEVDSEKLVPYRGVYETRVEFGGKIYKSLTSIGTRPTFDDSYQTIETYILDFDGDLYGKTIKLIFLRYLRPNMKFDTAEQLVSVLKMDVQNVRKSND